MSQCKRVWKALERHSQGVTQADFLPPNVIDGGHPITRLAARIRDLRDDGLDIVVDGERYGCAVYKIPQPEPVPIPESDISDIPFDEPPAADALFTVQPANAILGDAA